MEEKIVGKKKGSSLSFHISFTLISIESPSSVLIYSAPALDLPPHSGPPTTQDLVFALNEQYSTGQSDPNGRHQWNGTVGDRRPDRNIP